MNEVVPHTRCDLYSYSCWDIASNIDEFRKALDYIEKKVPDNALFGSRNIHLGEYGAKENVVGSKEAIRRVTGLTQAALDFGLQYVIYWEIYDNEAVSGTSDEPGDCPGLWLIKPSGAKAAVWDYFENLLKK